MDLACRITGIAMGFAKRSARSFRSVRTASRAGANVQRDPSSRSLLSD
jgi:hypothetical protein